MPKFLNNISNKQIIDGDLLNLNILILALGYIEEQKPCFIIVMKNNNKKLDKNIKKKLIVFNLKNKIIKKWILYKKKRCVACITGYVYA